MEKTFEIIMSKNYPKLTIGTKPTIYYSSECWHMPVILALRKLRQEDHDLQASLRYIAKLVTSKLK
jgi:hypothetical protein